MTEICYCPHCGNDSFYCYPDGYKCIKCLKEFYKLPTGQMIDGMIYDLEGNELETIKISKRMKK